MVYLKKNGSMDTARKKWDYKVRLRNKVLETAESAYITESVVFFFFLS